MSVPLPELLANAINEVTAVAMMTATPLPTAIRRLWKLPDLPARLDIIQIAEPSNLPEPGVIVTFTALIENISLVDRIRIDKIETNPVDPTLAPVDGSAACLPALPAGFESGDHLLRRFTKRFLGLIGARHTSSVIVTGADDDGCLCNRPAMRRSGDRGCPFLPARTKSANPVSVPEAGGLLRLLFRCKILAWWTP
ncbi:MAG: hypothetical protein R3E79_32255 [Caldilineaceae bacterium]